MKALWYKLIAKEWTDKQSFGIFLGFLFVPFIIAYLMTH